MYLFIYVWIFLRLPKGCKSLRKTGQNVSWSMLLMDSVTSCLGQTAQGLWKPP